MRCALVALVAACGPAVPRVVIAPDRKTEIREAVAAASGDAGAIGKLLRGSVIDGGLWFPDPGCRAQFPHGEELHEDRFQVFAACLAGLHWQPSARKDQLGDVIVLTYAPGFEIEMRVVREAWGPRIAWVGPESMRDASDGLPTISVSALEALRTSGGPNGPITVALEPDQHVWLKVCLDETGKVASVDVRGMTSIEAANAFSAAAKTWTFKPFLFDARPTPVCAMVRPTYQATKAPEEALPMPAPPSRSGKLPLVFDAGSKIVDGHRIQGEKAIYPPDRTKTEIRNRGDGKPVVGMFRICLDETGHPESILPLHSTGYADYDRALMSGMKRWVYSPFLVDGEPRPVCTAVAFLYTQQ